MSDIFEVKEEKKEVTVNDLVGPDRKFKTVDDLAKGKAESDAYITQLLEELKSTREALTKDNNAQENLRTLQQENADLKAKLAANVTSEKPRENTTPELTEDKLEAIVASVITKNEKTKTANQNMANAKTALVKLYGDKAQDVFKQKATELGMTVEELSAVAAKSPTALFKMIGVEPSKDIQAQLQTPSVNTNVPTPTQGAKVGTAAYYNEMRRKMGNQAFFADSKLQQEIWKAKKTGTYDQT